MIKSQCGNRTVIIMSMIPSYACCSVFERGIVIAVTITTSTRVSMVSSTRCFLLPVSVSVWFPVCKHDAKDDSEMYHTDTDTLPYRHRHSTIQTQTLYHTDTDTKA